MNLISQLPFADRAMPPFCRCRHRRHGELCRKLCWSRGWSGMSQVIN